MVAGLDYKMLMTEVGVADTNMNTLPQALGTSQTPVICLNTQDGQSREEFTQAQGVHWLVFGRALHQLFRVLGYPHIHQQGAGTASIVRLLQ